MAREKQRLVAEKDGLSALITQAKVKAEKDKADFKASVENATVTAKKTEGTKKKEADAKLKTMSDKTKGIVTTIIEETKKQKEKEEKEAADNFKEAKDQGEKDKADVKGGVTEAVAAGSARVGLTYPIRMEPLLARCSCRSVLALIVHVVFQFHFLAQVSFTRAHDVDLFT